MTTTSTTTATSSTEQPSRIAVVTGASRGLGRSMALHLAARGWGVVGTYQSRPDAADEVVEAVRAAGGTATFLPLDAGDPSSAPAFADALRARLQETFGRDTFDALVNNAGVGLSKPFVETTEEDLDRLLAIHVKTPYLLTQQLLALLVDGGQVLNVSSGLTRFAGPGSSAYAAAKGAVEVLTRYQAQELGARRIRVNVLRPGAIATDFNGGAVRDNAQYNAAVSAMIALGRPGEADEIGAGVAAILSDDLRWADGAAIELSGGQRL
ncbi:SDR family NAD(P)-dependent oxidoreductase [Microlunatus flavus]|uniref:NAD(P)-dependent dehydrogenase, short-chain alcohol dehydrogenase family n=1 Tax=Microlunatus flavus TaxID=1036181 RepID=A0A1H8ZZZ8_9ACTN|nr:SDR family oxidoreductase [Microlunatus flavus]SEP70076.1 NAD(P)-dependent dehydrogenase, short-chain alcohol dehydrogenase family [Microlunatus flavus]